MISESLNNLTFTAKNYDQWKIRTTNRFYVIITHHPFLLKLVEFVFYPEQEGGKRIPCFVLLTRGVKNGSKKSIINTCLMFVTQILRTKVSEGNGLD